MKSTTIKLTTILSLIGTLIVSSYGMDTDVDSKISTISLPNTSVLTSAPVSQTSTDLSSATPVSHLAPLPGRFYVGINFNNVRIQSSDSSFPISTLKDLQYKIAKDAQLDQPIIPSLHITLFNGTVTAADTVENQEALKKLVDLIRSELKSVNIDQKAILHNVEMGGLWAGIKDTGQTSPYNIVLNLSEKDNPFINMVGKVKQLIHKSPLAHDIHETKYLSYSDTLKQWDFKGQLSVDASRHDLSSGLLHTTLLTSYAQKPVQMKSYTQFEKILLDQLETSLSSIGKFKDVDEKNKAELFKILANIISTLKDTYNYASLRKDFDTKAEALGVGQKERNMFFNYAMKSINAALTNKTVSETTQERLNTLKDYLSKIMVLGSSQNMFVDLQHQLTNLKNLRKVFKTLNQNERTAANLQADAICSTHKKDVDGKLTKVQFDWDGINIHAEIK